MPAMDLLYGDVAPVKVGAEGFEGLLGVPGNAKGLVIFAHGSGSSRLSPRNNEVAAQLREVGLATLLLDLLRPEEERDHSNVFDVELLASRLVSATGWAEADSRLADLKIGYFGASTGAAAALVAAAHLGRAISAIVSRGGRPDLAGDALEYVRAPTLLIVGGADLPAIPLNRLAHEHLRTIKDIAIVKNAGHLFEEPGAMTEVIDLAREWFLRFLPKTEFRRNTNLKDRVEAGKKLAERLTHLKDENPIVLALPRGGVPVAYEVAKALGAPLDVVLVRKIGAPGQPELGLGAVVDGANPRTVYNEEVVRLVRPSERYLQAEELRQLGEIERRRQLYRRGCEPLPVKDRTVIVIDDGIATGGTVRAVLEALRAGGVKKLVLAVPVAPADTLEELSTLADEVIVLATPDPFYAVGAHYKNFDQTSDEEVIDLLSKAETPAVHDT
jgi:predicted phosphoribosyltransferase/pimeloyl-ACP methyl ester carboxylesterase